MAGWSSSEWPEYLDTALCALVFWGLFRMLRRRRQSYRILAGIVLLGLSYVLTQLAGFQLASKALLGMFVTCVVVAALVLQDDLRRALEWLTLAKRPTASPGVVDTLVRAASRMADAKVGALVVLPGREPVLPQVSGGVAIDAILSEPLLLSLFDPGSPGHDGALIVCGPKIERFAVHLPLSQNEEELAGRGTRHASALGISERTDALCIVVSEERGEVSLAQHGALKGVDEAGLRAALARHLKGFPGEHVQVSYKTRVGEVAFAILAALCMWFAVFPGGVVVSRVVRVPVKFENLPEGYQVDGPALEADVTVSGPRRAIYLLAPQDVEVALDAWFVGEGKRVFTIQRNDIRVPADMQALDVAPRRLELRIKRVGT